MISKLWLYLMEINDMGAIVEFWQNQVVASKMVEVWKTVCKLQGSTCCAYIRVAVYSGFGGFIYALVD